MKNLLTVVLTLVFSLAFSAPALADEANHDIACPACGLCPAPLGICIFYYIIAILAILFVVLLLNIRTKRCPLCKAKCKKNDAVCPKCGYDFESGLQSTLTIRVADSPELMELRGQNKPPQTDSAPAESLPESPAQPAAENPEEAVEFSQPESSPIDTPQTGTGKAGTADDLPPAVTPPAEKEESSTIILPAVALQEEDNSDPSAKTCPYCGAALNPKALFCGKCGKKLA